MYGLPLGGDWGGFLSDLVRVPYADAMLVPLPAGVDPAAAASVSDNIPDALADGRAAARREPGAAGPDLRRRRLDRRSTPRRSPSRSAPSGSTSPAAGPTSASSPPRFGADLLDEEFPERLGPYPITVDASGDHDGLACALRSTEPDGTCTSIGIYYEPSTPVPLLEMYTKGITFQTGRVHARPAMPPSARPDRRGQLRPAPGHGGRASPGTTPPRRSPSSSRSS